MLTCWLTDAVMILWGVCVRMVTDGAVLCGIVGTSDV